MNARRTTRRLLVAAAIASATMVACLDARAQDEGGPIVVGERPKYDKLSLYNWEATFEALYRYEHDTREDNAQHSRTEFTESRFEETLTVDAQGHIVHPNFVWLDLSTTFGLRQ